MTNLVALVLAVLILGLFALDALMMHWGLPVRIGRAMVQIIEWISFWR